MPVSHNQTLIFSLIVTLLLAHSITAQSIFPSISIPTLTPSDIYTDITCYALPYGAIGFLSHLLTYETLLCLIYSKSPWLPCRRLSEYKLDLVLGTTSLVSTGGLSLYALLRCRFAWEFALLIIWKMLLSISLAMMALHRGLQLRQVKKGERGYMSGSPGWWLVIYGFGIICGCIGLLGVLRRIWPTRTPAMDIITGAFAAFIVVAAITGAVVAKCVPASDGMGWYAFLAAVGAGGVGAALYCDWILAAIKVQAGGNWWGYPSGDVAVVYWAYFVAKRLPFMSF